MDEYIKREALIDRLLRVHLDMDNLYTLGIQRGITFAIEFIKEMPTADVAPVVRCEDCRHFRRNLENDTYCGCVGGLTDPEEHDFCSYGERKEGVSNEP